TGLLQKDDWRVYGKSIPASEVGGDYYDYFPLADGRLLVVIGDVSGHGVPAALVMAMAKATIRNEILNNPCPTAVFKKLNDLIFETMKKKRFMTFFYSLVNPEDQTVTFSNAGHCQAIVVKKNGEINEIGINGFPLGISRKSNFKLEKISLERGDRIYYYTDGFPETLDLQNEPFGYQRMKELLKSSYQKNITDACENIFLTVQKFRFGDIQDDDLSLIILEYK
ncbi:MAG: PP2C family protein-serine/threonine phosphatase, partial [Candidatus Riflebacteria bacterium]|nr:PP2C family protein-serine/threonine phosphatase [Candidatus Riflebacteria bacterium]